MNHPASPSSPPPLYSTFPGPDNRPGTGPSNERTPLMNPQTTKRHRECLYTLKVMMGILLLLVLLTASIWHFVDDYYNTHRTDVQERNRLRRIEHEDAQRNLVHKQVDEERRSAFEEEKQWLKEQRQRQERAFAREEERRKLAHEKEDDKRRKQRDREDKAIKDEEARRKSAHKQEDEQRMAEKEREDRIIRAREIIVARREQTIEAKENAMREDEERRKRAALTWQDLIPEKRCLSYEERMYQAKLINIPYGEDAQNWCMKTAIDIHGVTFDHPEFCTEERQDGAVSIVGHWTVTSNEPTCKTWWGNHEKKGCSGSRKMRVEAFMFNHQEPWDNWAEMCFSTPSEFARKSFAHPDTCENRGKYGIAGTWFIDVDESECP
ncbi:hypothetical protein ARMGADRAFT_1091334 [Armillaria gallica]|uniref:Uncharacterized protein n=1 Tax=Armillaria gallica TaxID=47427 RepID=A0A2H3CSP2_ARMGA|nr:hypothetical protein ARMGADRAFT_1091334 [Armillaria gallica]